MIIIITTMTAMQTVIQRIRKYQIKLNKIQCNFRNAIYHDLT